MPDREIFTRSRVIIVEGEEDAAFTRALLSSYSDTLPEFDVSPTIDVGGIGGNSGFKTAVMTADVLRGFSDVSDVVIVGDNDQNPRTSFDAIRNQIEAVKASGDVSRDWAVPNAPYAKEAGDPSVSVWLWPGAGQQGCLETILWQAICAQNRYNAIVTCVDNAMRCAEAHRWPPSKLDKARIHCFVALHHKKSPSISLSKIWEYAPDLIRIRSPQFTPFLNFLRGI